MSKPKLKFKGLEKCSLIQWPGRMVTITYTPECNLRCPDKIKGEFNKCEIRGV